MILKAYMRPLILVVAGQKTTVEVYPSDTYSYDKLVVCLRDRRTRFDKNGKLSLNN